METVMHPEVVASRDTLLLTLTEVAIELRCTRRSVERQIAQRKLRVIRIGRSVWVERSELERFLDRLRAQDHDW